MFSESDIPCRQRNYTIIGQLPQEADPAVLLRALVLYPVSAARRHGARGTLHGNDIAERIDY